MGDPVHDLSVLQINYFTINYQFETNVISDFLD